ncbi:MAG: hypothetical protein V4633_25225 [Pseudomonadota bacterium]
MPASKYLILLVIFWRNSFRCKIFRLSARKCFPESFGYFSKEFCAQSGPISLEYSRNISHQNGARCHAHPGINPDSTIAL